MFPANHSPAVSPSPVPGATFSKAVANGPASTRVHWVIEPAEDAKHVPRVATRPSSPAGTAPVAVPTRASASLAGDRGNDAGPAPSMDCLGLFRRRPPTAAEASARITREVAACLRPSCWRSSPILAARLQRFIGSLGGVRMDDSRLAACVAGLAAAETASARSEGLRVFRIAMEADGKVPRGFIIRLQDALHASRVPLDGPGAISVLNEGVHMTGAGDPAAALCDCLWHAAPPSDLPSPAQVTAIVHCASRMGLTQFLTLAAAVRARTSGDRGPLDLLLETFRREEPALRNAARYWHNQQADLDHLPSVLQLAEDLQTPAPLGPQELAGVLECVDRRIGFLVSPSAATELVLATARELAPRDRPAAVNLMLDSRLRDDRHGLSWIPIVEWACGTQVPLKDVLRKGILRAKQNDDLPLLRRLNGLLDSALRRHDLRSNSRGAREALDALEATHSALVTRSRSRANDGYYLKTFGVQAWRALVMTHLRSLPDDCKDRMSRTLVTAVTPPRGPAVLAVNPFPDAPVWKAQRQFAYELSSPAKVDDAIYRGADQMPIELLHAFISESSGKERWPVVVASLARLPPLQAAQVVLKGFSSRSWFPFFDEAWENLAPLRSATPAWLAGFMMGLDTQAARGCLDPELAPPDILGKITRTAAAWTGEQLHGAYLGVLLSRASQSAGAMAAGAPNPWLAEALQAAATATAVDGAVASGRLAQAAELVQAPLGILSQADSVQGTGLAEVVLVLPTLLNEQGPSPAALESLATLPECSLEDRRHLVRRALQGRGDKLDPDGVAVVHKLLLEAVGKAPEADAGEPWEPSLDSIEDLLYFHDQFETLFAIDQARALAPRSEALVTRWEAGLRALERCRSDLADHFAAIPDLSRVLQQRLHDKSDALEQAILLRTGRGIPPRHSADHVVQKAAPTRESKGSDAVQNPRADLQALMAAVPGAPGARTPQGLTERISAVLSSPGPRDEWLAHLRASVPSWTPMQRTDWAERLAPPFAAQFAPTDAARTLFEILVPQDANADQAGNVAQALLRAHALAAHRTEVLDALRLSAQHEQRSAAWSEAFGHRLEDLAQPVAPATGPRMA